MEGVRRGLWVESSELNLDKKPWENGKSKGHVESDVKPFDCRENVYVGEFVVERVQLRGPSAIKRTRECLSSSWQWI